MASKRNSRINDLADRFSPGQHPGRNGQHATGSPRQTPLTGDPSVDEPPAEPLGLTTTRLDQIKARPTRWLVPDRIPLGKLVAYFGDGGWGKSTATLQLAADLSRGRPMLGLNYPDPIAGETLLIACEDDYEDTVVPRLLAMDADLTKIHRVDGVALAGGKTDRFTMACYLAMEEELQKNPAIRLVVIDPAGAYIGGKDDHKDSELRQLLGPLSEVANKRNVCIILVKHVNKTANAKAVQRVTGSVAWVNAVRAAFLFAPSPDNDDLVVMALAKGNLSRKPKALAFRPEALPYDELQAVLASPALAHLTPDQRAEMSRQLFRPVWKGESTFTADDLVTSKEKKERDPTKIEQAMAWIKQALGEYAWPSDELSKAGKAAGFTFDNLKEAKTRLKAEGYTASNMGRFRGIWWYGKGKPDTWKLRPESGESDPDTPETPNTPNTPDYGKEPVHSRETRESRECRGCWGSEDSGHRDTLPCEKEVFEL